MHEIGENILFSINHFRKKFNSRYSYPIYINKTPHSRVARRLSRTAVTPHQSRQLASFSTVPLYYP